MELPEGWKRLYANNTFSYMFGRDDQESILSLLKEMAEALENISKMDWLNAISYHQQNKANEALKKFKEWK